MSFILFQVSVSLNTGYKFMKVYTVGELLSYTNIKKLYIYKRE